MECFNALKFSYDLYTTTESDFHKMQVQEMLVCMKENGFLCEKIENQDYCEVCGKFLADREIVGSCPVCGTFAKGDQCDNCLTSFDTKELKERSCIACGGHNASKPQKEIVFEMSRLQEALQQFFELNKDCWRLNAINETKKYLDEGLRDRDVTRNLNWGIKIPFSGYEDKRLYVWFDAVLGYLTVCKHVLEKRGESYDEFIKDSESLRTYYVHGKDNIPFHTIILPALILAQKCDVQLPKFIVSSEYVIMGEEKMSKSKGNIILVKDLLNQFTSDSIRFYFILNNPERKDITFSKDDLISTHNKLLVGGLGNFVNRNLSFLKSKFGGVVPNGEIDNNIRKLTESLYVLISKEIESGNLRSAMDKLVQYIQAANKYYDDSKPWLQSKQNDLTDFNNTTATCIYIIANMSNLFNPFIPDGCAVIRNMLSLKLNKWKPINVGVGLLLDECPLLYTRL
jgi:Methionyl-tRNA synthetase